MKRLRFYAIMVTILLILSMCWGGFNYIQKKSCQQQQSFAEKVAKKDSIKAKQADNRLLNVVRPDSVKVDPQTGQTILYVSNNTISRSPIYSATYLATDTNYYYQQGQQSGDNKYSESAVRQADVIQRLNKELAAVTHALDSVQNAPYKFNDKYLSFEQTKREKEGVISDSVSRRYNAVLVPSLTFRGKGKHYVGIPQWDTGSFRKEKNVAVLSFTSPDPALRFYGTDSTYSLALRQPRFGGAIQGTINRTGLGHIATGIGFRGYYKNYNLYLIWYYDMTGKEFLRQPTISFSRNIITF